MIEKGSEKTVNLTLGELPAQREAKADPQGNEQSAGEADKLGLSLAPAGNVAGAGSQGVVITGVELGGPAEAAGLQRGDVIQEVNHETVKTVDDYLKAANKIKKDELAVLLVNRQGNSLFVAVNPK